MRILMAIAICCATALAQAQDTLGNMRGDGLGYAQVLPGKSLQFPRDHGAHPDFRIEWWYLTANLQGENGRDYGIQWTLFRSALKPFQTDGWQNPQLWLGHAAVTTPDNHFLAERLSRGGDSIGSARARP